MARPGPVVSFEEGSESVLVSFRLHETEGDPVARQKQELLRRLGVPLDQRVEAGSGIPEQEERLLIAARVVALQEEELYFVRGLGDPLVPGPWSVRFELQALQSIRCALSPGSLLLLKVWLIGATQAAPLEAPLQGSTRQALPCVTEDVVLQPLQRVSSCRRATAPSRCSHRSVSFAEGLTAGAGTAPLGVKSPPSSPCNAAQRGVVLELLKQVTSRLRAIVQYPPAHGIGKEHSGQTAPPAPASSLSAATKDGGAWQGRPLVHPETLLHLGQGQGQGGSSISRRTSPEPASVAEQELDTNAEAGAHGAAGERAEAGAGEGARDASRERTRRGDVQGVQLRVGEGSAEVDLVRWALRGGASTRLIPADFEGTGRGMMAVEDVEAGDEVMRIPLRLIITPRLVLASPRIKAFQKALLDARTARLVAASVAGLPGPGPGPGVGGNDAKRRRAALPGALDEETLLLLWTVAEMEDEASSFRPFFRSLPLQHGLQTGLSFGQRAMEALEGTLLGPELENAQQHLKERYSSLFPSLSDAFPELLPPDVFTWHSFRAAAELWYAYGMKLALPVEGEGTSSAKASTKGHVLAGEQEQEAGAGTSAAKLSSCLVPLGSLLNHSVYPHITHYSSLERWQGREGRNERDRTVQPSPLTHAAREGPTPALGEPCVVLRAVRPCPRGAQCFLFYGPLSTAHQLLFYGFISPPPRHHPNPYDAIPIDLSPPDDEPGEETTMSDVETRNGTALEGAGRVHGEAGELVHTKVGQVTAEKEQIQTSLTADGVLKGLGLGPSPFSHHLRVCGAHLDPDSLLLSWVCPCSGKGTATQDKACHGCAAWGSLPPQLLLAVSVLCMGEEELRHTLEAATSFDSIAQALSQVLPETLLAAIEALEGMLQALVDPLEVQGEATGELPEGTGVEGEAEKGTWDLQLVAEYKVSLLKILKSAQKCLGALKAEAIAVLL